MGPSNVGLTDPAQHTALHLVVITAVLNQHHSGNDLETAALVDALVDLCDVVSDEFWLHEQQFERSAPEPSALRHDLAERALTGSGPHDEQV